MGWTSYFPEITETSRAQISKPVGRNFLFSGNNENIKCALIRDELDRVKRILVLIAYASSEVQASLHIRAVSPEPSLLAHISSESRGTLYRKPDPWPH